MRSVSSHWLVVITSAWSVWRYRDNNEGTVAMCDVSASVDDDDVSVCRGGNIQDLDPWMIRVKEAGA